MEQFAREAVMGFQGTLRAEDRDFVETAARAAWSAWSEPAA